MANIESRAVDFSTDFDKSKTERDAFGTPTWVFTTGPRVNEKVKADMPSLRSYRDQTQPSKAELRAMAEAALNSCHVTRID
jgi:hypothetical protein